MSGLMSLVPHLPWKGAPLGPLYIHWSQIAGPLARGQGISPEASGITVAV